MDMELKGKVTLVTGSARDVGREIALSLAAEGAAVAVNYNGSAEKAKQVVADIGSRGGRAIAYRADVADFGRGERRGREGRGRSRRSQYRRQ